MLRLEAEAAAVRVDFTSLSLERAVEEITGIELHSWLGGEHLHDASRLRLLNLSNPGKRSGNQLVGHEVMIVAARELELLVLGIDAGADRSRLTEVQRRTLDRGNLASGNKGLIDRCIVAGVERQDLVEDGAVTLTRKVKVTVMGQIDDRVLVGSGSVDQLQLVFVRESVGGGHLERSGIPLLAILARVGELEGGAVCGDFRSSLPDDLVESLDSAVKGIADVVGSECVLLAIKSEFPLGNAVTIAANEASEVRALLDILSEGIESEDDIRKLPVAVRHCE